MPGAAPIAPEDVPPLADLVAVCHLRWSVPALALLGECGGAKFITMVNRLGVSRDALSRTLARLAALDLAMRNPGYGHPMRPEWILTPFGEAAAPACQKVCHAAARTGERGAAATGLKWSLPVLACLHAGVDRFAEMDARLPGATPRALAQTLARLVDAELVERRVVPGPPTGVRYRLTGAGRAVGREAANLAAALAPDVGSPG